MHEKYMQMAFASQLRRLGVFLNEKLLDVRHTFTGFKFTKLLNKIMSDPALNTLMVTKEMDVLALTESKKLLGFEHKSKKGLMAGDYGFDDAEKYYCYGIEYVYVVHREINDRFHKQMLEQIKSKYRHLGYIVYSLKKLKILKTAESNPLILSNRDVAKRGKFIKEHFGYAGGVKGPF